MSDDAQLPGPGRFPTTRHSLIAATRSPDPELARRSLAAVAAAYWKPVFKHVRLKWRRDTAEAEDLTQAFFEVALARDYLAAFAPERGRFRTFLRTCVDRYVSKDVEAARADKRGGGAVHLALDFGAAEQELAQATVDDVETVFEREWRRSVFELAVASLRERSRDGLEALRFAIFEAYDLTPAGRPTYAELAERFGLPATSITNHLHAARAGLREAVHQTLAQLCATDEELAAEARALWRVER